MTIKNGLFEVELNSGGQFGSNAFQGDARWLQLDVRCPAGGAGNYTLLRPRQPLTAAPFAQHTRGLLVDAENSLGVGAAPPGGVRLFLQGTTALDSAAIKSDRGPNYSHVHFGPSGDWYIRSAAAAGKVILQDSGGNVGIGTTNPGRLLQLGDPNRPNSEAMIRLASRSGNNANQRTWDIGVPETDDDLYGFGYSFVIDDTQRGIDPEFIVQWGTGYVGIGTAFPEAPLHVSANDCSLRFIPGYYFSPDFGDVYDPTAATIDVSGPDSYLVIADQLYAQQSASIASNLTVYGELYAYSSYAVFDGNLSVHADAFKPGGGPWSALSDARAKRDIEPVCDALDTVLQLQGVTFQYTAEAIADHKGLPGEQIGFVADEVEKVLPSWVKRDADGYRYLTERGATALLVEALRDLREEKDRQLAERDATLAGQQTQIDEFRATVAARDAQIADLAARLERLERSLGAMVGR